MKLPATFLCFLVVAFSALAYPVIEDRLFSKIFGGLDLQPVATRSIMREDLAPQAIRFWRTDGTAGTWTGLNWSASPTATGGSGWTAGNDANFTGNSTVTYVSGTSFANITVDPNSTVTVTQAGTAPALARIYDIGSNSTLTWSSQNFTASGTGFTKNGSGTWGLGAIGNAYTGGFTLNAGTVIVSGNNSFGGSGSALSITGGTIQSSGNRAFAPSSINIGGDFSFTGTGNATFSGAVGLGSATRTVTNNQTSGSLIFGGVISSGGMTLNGTGVTTLTAANTYTGATTISGGVLSVGTIGNGGVAGNLGQATSAASNLVFDGGTLRYTGLDASTNRNFTINPGKTAIFDITTNLLTVSGASTATDGGLTKTGNGFLNLTGTNLYSGKTTVRTGGVLALVGSGSIANSTVIEIEGGAFFDVSSLTAALTLSSGQAIQATGTATTGILATVSGKGLTTAANSPLQFTAFNGTTPPLTVQGSGTLALQSSNPVTVTVSNGGNPLAIGDYKLISKGATGTVVGTPTSIIVNGDGVNGTPSLVLISDELFLRVQAAAAPGIMVIGGPLNFGNQAVGTTSGSLNVTITNTGTANLVLGTPAFTTGTQFAFTSNPNGTTLVPTESVILSFTFTPTSVGVKGDTVTINSNAPDPAPTVSLSGTGTNPHFRSAATGNWNSNATWEIDPEVDGTFVPATSTPTDLNSGSILIRNGHNVSVSADVAVDQAVVELGGTITIAAGQTLTASNGTGADITVNGFGSLLNQGTLSPSAGSSITVNSNGNYIHNTTSSAAAVIPSMSLDANSRFIYRHSASFALGEPTPALSGFSYGNLLFENPTATNYFTSASGSGTLTVNGSMSVHERIAVNLSGFSGPINIANDLTLGLFNSIINASLSTDTGLLSIGDDFSIDGTGALNIGSGGANVGGDIQIDNLFGASSFSNAGTLTLNGTAAQTWRTLGTQQNISWGSVGINKPSGGVTLLSETEVGSLALTSGIVTSTASNILRVLNAVSGGSASSYVNGPMDRLLLGGLSGPNAFLFPVGKGGYNPFELVDVSTSVSNVTIRAEAFDGNSGGTAGTGLSTLNTDRYWSASATQASDLTSTRVRLTNSSPLNASNRIGRSATQGGGYDSIGGTSLADVITSDPISSLSFFAIGTVAPAPTTQASNITFSSVDYQSMTVNWTNGNGAKRIVVVNTSNSFTDPVNGTDPVAVTYTGLGQAVIYNGTGNSLLLENNLYSGVTYYFRVYEYTGTGATTAFLTTTATNNPNSQATDPTTITISDVSKVETSAGTTTFTFNVNKLGTAPGAVDWQVNAVSPTNGTDLPLPQSGTLNFPSSLPGAGSTLQINVIVNGDTSVEPNETFTVDISTSDPNLNIVDNQAVGTIQNDDVDPIKALWVFGGSIVPDPVEDATGRANLVNRSAAAGINELYVSVYQGTADPDSLRLMYADDDMAALISAAHASGQKVWAAYGAPDWPTLTVGCSASSFPVDRMEEVAAYNASRPLNERFDGVMLDVEPAPVAEADFQALIAHYECMRASLSVGIKLGAAISAFWDDNIVEYPVGSMNDKPASNHIIDRDLDRVVVMGYRDTAGPDTCAIDGIICLDKAEIDYATSINKYGLILAGLETINPASAGLLNKETFFEEGQMGMNIESANVASYFGTSSGFGGVAIHNYGAAFLSGSDGWPLGPTAAPASLGGRVVTARGVGIRNVLVTVSGGTSGESRTLTTGTFGHYRFDGLQAGESYVVTVRAKRYVFETPSQLVSLSDNVDDLNFVASP